jgi:hypothetical protein
VNEEALAHWGLLHPKQTKIIIIQTCNIRIRRPVVGIAVLTSTAVSVTITNEAVVPGM